MGRMGKWICILLAMALLVVLAAGCKPSGKGGNDTGGTSEQTDEPTESTAEPTTEPKDFLGPLDPTKVTDRVIEGTLEGPFPLESQPLLPGDPGYEYILPVEPTIYEKE